MHRPHPARLGSRIRARGTAAPAPGALEGSAQGVAPSSAAAPAAGKELPTPPVLTVKPNGSATLTMRTQNYDLAGRPAKNLRVYDKPAKREFLMGPTLEFGQTGAFNVQLSNELPLNPDQAQPHIVNIPNQFNTTNLHTHGLHVSPQNNGDNVYIKVLPKGTNAKYADGKSSFIGEFRYTYTLSNHTPGTFWYHPHRHGSVAVQVASGAAGALIVRGGPGTVDAVPGIAGVKEQVLLIQQVVLDQNGELPDFDFLWNAPQDAGQWTVNGTIGHTLPMQPGEVQRWRIVNTGFQAETKFALFQQGADGTLTPVKVMLIAMDGVNLTKAPMVEGAYLPPGGRADILVQAPAQPGQLVVQVGSYVVQDNFVPKAGLTAGFEVGGVYQEAAFVGTPETVFTVRVAGPARPMPLPSNPLPAPLLPAIDPSTKPDEYRSVQFAFTAYDSPQGTPNNKLPTYNPAATPTAFKLQINGELFCPGRVMFAPKLGTVDQYFVSAPDMHVFHIHVNPFLVTEVAGQPLSMPQWRDTMLVGPSGYKALTKYTDYPGTFPIHCHILDHEDVGMMTNVSVVSPAGGNPPPAPHGH